jgi:hypothetical protein
MLKAVEETWLLYSYSCSSYVHRKSQFLSLPMYRISSQFRIHSISSRSRVYSSSFTNPKVTIIASPLEPSFELFIEMSAWAEIRCHRISGCNLNMEKELSFAWFLDTTGWGVCVYILHSVEKRLRYPTTAPARQSVHVFAVYCTGANEWC